MPRSLSALTVLAMALAVTGCGGGGSSSSSTSSTPAVTGGAAGTTSTSSTPSSSPDNSIQTYGSAAQGNDKAAVIAAMRSFMGALAAPNYAKVCTEITSSMRFHLKQFTKSPQIKAKSCAGVLSKLLHSQRAAAKKAADAPITAVRTKGPTAFVLFRPAAGQTSFFVMKRENGAWKAIGLGTGTPLTPALPGH